MNGQLSDKSLTYNEARMLYEITIDERYEITIT